MNFNMYLAHMQRRIPHHIHANKENPCSACYFDFALSKQSRRQGDMEGLIRFFHAQIFPSFVTTIKQMMRQKPFSKSKERWHNMYRHFTVKLTSHIWSSPASWNATHDSAREVGYVCGHYASNQHSAQSRVLLLGHIPNMFKTRQQWVAPIDAGLVTWSSRAVSFLGHEYQAW